MNRDIDDFCYTVTSTQGDTKITSTNSDNFDDTITNLEFNNCTTETIITATVYDNADIEFINKLIKRGIKESIKDSWGSIKKQFKSLPKIRPNIQLRGVSFGGRGWA